ncbi:MAG TPA: hypothetical protein VHW25_03500 [Steroidobacteraceae bacterium]|jgi:hypothetical protein|nr:hypothetical protein [Steroidobacteraceae bacterium]
MKPVIEFGILACALALVACATPPGSGKPGSNGYYTKVVGGEQLYCRNDLKLGSHVEREGEKCYTPDQYKAMEDANSAAVSGSVSTQHGSQSIQ